MKWIKTTIIFCILIHAGCSTVHVSYDHDPSYDFTKLKTYDWIPNTAPISRTKLIEKHVRRVVNDQLGDKGYIIDNNNPDFYIVLHTGKERKIDVSSRGYGYRGLRGGIVVYQYEEGTLVLDFVDAKKMGLIYRGIATAELLRSSSFEKRQERINETVEKILKQFPPDGKK